MKHIVCCLLLAITSVTAALAQDHPLKKGAVGDWAKYLVTTKNETIPLMSTKDNPRWRVISTTGDDWVRVDNYITVGDRRSSGLGTLVNFSDRYEPVPGISKTAKIQVVSTSKEKMTIGGKQYDCTKVVRKVDQSVDDENMGSSWNGTSTVWFCPQVPLGIAKMENAYHSRLTKDDEGMKITETWILAESGFKDWKNEE